MTSRSNYETRGHVFNIQRFSTHDGPGIRTTVFLKGCPLRCFWCQNPESQCIDPVLMFNKDLCTGCGSCVPHCPQKAIYLAGGKGALDREICKACGECTTFCSQHARTLAGHETTVGEVMSEILKDRFTFLDSGGGVTVSGGDPTVQWSFTRALLQSCRDTYLHTAIETCGYAKWEILEPIVDLCDLVFFDLKCIDSDLHKRGTGVSNELILDNARKLVGKGVNVKFRTPLIPSFNDGPEHIEVLRDFLVNTLGIPGTAVELLKYNKLGEDKFLRLDALDKKPELVPQTDEYIESLYAILRK